MTRRVLTALAGCFLLLTAAGLHAQEDRFDSNGVKLRYSVVGEGEPVVLIHGFSVNPQIQWDLPGITKGLAKEYKVITLDNRGHGRSGKPHDPGKYGVEMVEDVVRLLDHLKIQKAHVVGYSMGAFITLKMLTTHPDRLRTATLGGAGRRRHEDLGFLDVLANALDKNDFGPLVLRLNPEGRPKPTEQEIKQLSLYLTAMNDTKALAASIRGLKGLVVTDE